MDAATWLKSLEDSGGQERRSKLAELSTFVAAVKTLEELVLEAPARVSALCTAEYSVLHVLDVQSNQLFSLIKTGTGVKEVLAPSDPTNVAGLVSITKASISIKSLQDAAELGRLHPKLKFDDRADRNMGRDPRSLMGIPILHEKAVIGVLQLFNRKDKTPFVPRDIATAQDAAATLAAPLYALTGARTQTKAPPVQAPPSRVGVPPVQAPPSRVGVPPVQAPPSRTGAPPVQAPQGQPLPVQGPQARVSRQADGNWAHLLEVAAITTDALDKALQAAAAAQLDPARFLVEKVGVNRSEVEASLSAFYNCPFFRFTGF